MTLTAITAGAVFAASCSDDCNESSMSRLFRPIINADNVIAGLDADTIPYLTMTWDNYTSANQYTISLTSEDGLENFTQTVDTTTVTFNNLSFDKNYNISISAGNTQTGLESRAYTLTATTSDFPTLLQPLSSTDIIDVMSRVNWDTKDGATKYDSLCVYKSSNDSLVYKLVPTETQLANGNALLEQMEPSTNYYVAAYTGGAYKGKRSFKTTASESYEGTVADFRSLSDEESLGAITTDTLKALVEQYPDQDITIVLKGGVDYQIETVKLPQTTGVIKFVTGLTLSGNAVFKVDGNFDVSNGNTTGGVSFEKIFFDEGIDKKKTAGNYGGTYIFNPNAAAEIGSVDFKSCTIKYKRGVARFRKTSVKTFTMDDCIADSIGGYGIVNLDAAGSTVTNIVISNSTFSHCDVMFSAASKNAYIPPSSIKIENCTFAYFCNNGKCLFDYDKNKVGEITLKNCMFGIAKSSLQGWKGETAPNPTDCYVTSDFEWKVAEGATEPAAAFEVTTLKTDMSKTFKDPEHSDFSIIDSGANNIGDPRWYK